MKLPKQSPFLGWVGVTLLFSVLAVSCRDDPVRRMGEDGVTLNDPAPRLCGGRCCFLTEPGLSHCDNMNGPPDPNSVAEVVCLPSPLTRGDTVTCIVRLDTAHTFVMDSIFSVRVLLPDAAGVLTYASSQDSLNRIIPFGWSDGVDTVIDGRHAWMLKGPAVSSSEFSVVGFAKDSAGATYKIAAPSSFTIDSFPIQDSLTTSATVSTTHPYFDSILEPKAFIDSKTGQARMMWGLTASPIMAIAGTTDSEYVSVAFFGEISETYLNALPMDTVLVGPNSGVRYIAASLKLGPMTTAFSPAIYGDGLWADTQTGFGPSFPPSYPSCNRLSMPDLWTRLETYVKKHEGSQTGANSHFNIWKDGINSGTMRNMAKLVQRRVFYGPSTTFPVMAVARKFADSTLVPLTDAANEQLDSLMSVNSHKIANCVWEIKVF